MILIVCMGFSPLSLGGECSFVFHHPDRATGGQLAAFDGDGLPGLAHGSRVAHCLDEIIHLSQAASVTYTCPSGSGSARWRSVSSIAQGGLPS
jgi:hypothetical protein